MKFFSKKPGHYCLYYHVTTSYYAEIWLELCANTPCPPDDPSVLPWLEAARRGIASALADLEREHVIDKPHAIRVAKFQGLQTDTRDSEAEACAYMAAISFFVRAPGLEGGASQPFSFVWPSAKS